MKSLVFGLHTAVIDSSDVQNASAAPRRGHHAGSPRMVVDAIAMWADMTFRIETAARGRLTVFILSGRIETQAMSELKRLFEGQTDWRDIVLDLKDVRVIDRDVVPFLMSCEAEGVKLENCASYVREWMEREKD